MGFISFLRRIVPFERDRQSGGGILARGKGKFARRSGRRLAMEPLEERQMLSISVETLDDIDDADDGLTSLREALDAIYEGGVEEEVEIIFDEAALRSNAGANVFMIGWKWSDEIAAGDWYFNGTAVVKNTGVTVASGWTPGQGYGSNDADEKSTLLNLTVDVSLWQYTEIIPVESYYFDGTNAVQNTSGTGFAAGWLPADWTGGALGEDEIEAFINESNWTLYVLSSSIGPLSIDGTLNAGQTVNISSADPLAAGVMITNYGGLTLADIQISAQTF